MADKAEFGNNSSKICPGCMVGIPTMGLVDAEFMLSIANMQLPLNWRGGNFILRGKPVDAARNELVEIALRQGFEWLFFRDDDVIAPPDALNRLSLAHADSGGRGLWQAMADTPHDFQMGRCCRIHRLEGW